VPGVSEVASLGGLGRQYQVNVDPNRQRNYGLSIQRRDLQSGHDHPSGNSSDTAQSHF
jgi:Cu(I)/Ag(I) efflux system membrane protein CusA/SilA